MGLAFFVVQLLSISLVLAEFQLDVTEKITLEDGKQRYEMLRADSEAPGYGVCWTKAVIDLHTACKHLTDESQSRLALSLANCFLDRAGLKTYPCCIETPIKDCLANIDNNAFTAYTNFFTHTHNMCYFLQSQVWRQYTENTISRLSSVSEDTVKKLDDSALRQDTLLTLQRKSIESQEAMLQNGAQLSKSLEMSEKTAKNIIETFKEHTSEQKAIIFEMFNRIAFLQSFVLDEYTGIVTVFYYLVSSCISYLLTSANRTQNARLWLFGLMALTAFLERLLTGGELSGNEYGKLTETLVYSRIWLIRKISCGMAVVILSVCAYFYKDYNYINNRLLLTIQNQNAELKGYLQAMGSRNTSLSNGNGAILPCNGLTNLPAPFRYQEHMGTSGYNTESDSTFIASDSDISDNDQELDEDDPFFTAPGTTNGTPDDLEELTDMPLRSLPRKGSESCYSSSVNGFDCSPRYNFRPRASVLSPNPVLETETANNFMVAIERVAKISSRKNAEIRRAIRSSRRDRREQSEFSDD